MSEQTGVVLLAAVVGWLLVVLLLVLWVSVFGGEQ